MVGELLLNLSYKCPKEGVVFGGLSMVGKVEPPCYLIIAEDLLLLKI